MAHINTKNTINQMINRKENYLIDLTSHLQELGQHIKTWREVVLEKTQAQLFRFMDEQQPQLGWELNHIIQIEKGNWDIELKYWINIANVMGRGKAVIEAAQDLNGIYIAEAEKNTDPDEIDRAFNFLKSKGAD